MYPLSMLSLGLPALSALLGGSVIPDSGSTAIRCGTLIDGISDQARMDVYNGDYSEPVGQAFKLP